jgi:suppressor of G2 allele of SKP1
VEHLFGEIDEGKGAQVSVRSMKVEVTLTKKAALQWPSLECTDEDIVRALNNAAEAAAKPKVPPSAPLAYPNSKGRDWSKPIADEKEEEEKPSGDQALNQLFQRIYADGSEEQRKAMIKSYTESNGTVLSTNWNEVGTKKVDWQPPKGMEAKRYDE